METASSSVLIKVTKIENCRLFKQGITKLTQMVAVELALMIRERRARSARRPGKQGRREMQPTRAQSKDSLNKKENSPNNNR